MREILFRGKLKADNGEYKKGDWGFGDLVRIKDGDHTKTYIYGFGEVIPETVGQFTGLYDATPYEELTVDEQALFLYPENGGKRSKEDWKGRPIFEGDIVRCGKWEYGRTPMYGYIVYGTCCFCVQDIKSKNNPAMDLCHDFKVIGNIHDNPELLEVTK